MYNFRDLKATFLKLSRKIKVYDYDAIYIYLKKPV